MYKTYNTFYDFPVIFSREDYPSGNDVGRIMERLLSLTDDIENITELYITQNILKDEDYIDLDEVIYLQTIYLVLDRTLFLPIFETSSMRCLVLKIYHKGNNIQSLLHETYNVESSTNIDPDFTYAKIIVGSNTKSSIRKRISDN